MRSAKLSRRNITVNTSEGNRNRSYFPNFFTDPRLDPDMRRAMFRWCFYKFPIIQKPSTEESEKLWCIWKTYSLSEEEYGRFVEGITQLFNQEKECWGKWILLISYVKDVRTRLSDIQRQQKLIQSSSG